ncbi:MAG: acetyl-CoA C-acyltransferase, partial [Candidatus Margulisbacteria bacterium]|nr:acetyl-CoA C-acyltransferase [Candidatus Margulisiibacteriota bacterium]
MMTKQDRIAIVDGLRTPMCKSGGVFKNLSADDLAVNIMKELIARTNIDT